MKLINMIATHLAKQQKLSESKLGCAYRGRDGAMCAVGCLIPDELYTDRIETLSYSGMMRDDDTEAVREHLLKILVEEPFTDVTPLEFYSAAQQFHDCGDYENCIQDPAFKEASEEEQVEMVKEALIRSLRCRGVQVHPV